MSFDYGPKKPDGQHTNHPAMSQEIPLIQEIREKYVHNKCGGLTRMPAHCARTYAQDPGYYGKTFCCSCGDYFVTSEFVWDKDGKPINKPINEA